MKETCVAMYKEKLDSDTMISPSIQIRFSWRSWLIGVEIPDGIMREMLSAIVHVGPVRVCFWKVYKEDKI